MNNFELFSQMRDAIGLVVGWSVIIEFGKEGRKLVEYNINGRMLVSGKDFSITKYVMPDDIDDTQDPRCHMRRRTFLKPVYNVLCTWGFAWAWMAVRARNVSPSGRATFNPQSTCHGPRPGPKLAYGVRAGSLCAMEQRARRKTRGRKRKKCRIVKKTSFYTEYIQGFPSGSGMLPSG